MTLEITLPSPDLRHIIRHYEWIKVPETYEQAQTVTMLPSLAMGFIFVCKRKRDFILVNKKVMPTSMSALGLIPATLIRSQNYHYGGVEVVRVIFQLGALSLLLKSSLAEFTNNQTFLMEGLSDEYKALEEKVILADTYAARIACIEDFVRQQLARAKEQQALQFAITPEQWRDRHLKVQDLAKDMGYSTRQLRRIFDKSLGLSPKMFIRLVRYNAALQLMHRRQHINLTDIAYQCGYHDQAHFIHEFKEFTEQTPSSFIQEKGKDIIEVDDISYRGYLVKKGLGTV